jgi:hypothetical protein
MGVMSNPARPSAAQYMDSLRLVLESLGEQLAVVQDTLEVVSCPGQPDYEAAERLRYMIDDAIDLIARAAVHREAEERRWQQREEVYAHQRNLRFSPVGLRQHDPYHGLNLNSGAGQAGQFQDAWANRMQLERERNKLLGQQARDLGPPQADAIPDREAVSLAAYGRGSSPPEPIGVMVPVGVAESSPAAGSALAAVKQWGREIGGLLQRPNAEAKAKTAEETAKAQMAFSYWQVVMNKSRSVMDEKRLVRIKARLKESGGDVSELLYAIDAAAKDDWLMGRDQRAPRAYNGIETIFRDRAQVEQLAERMGGYKRGEPHPSLKVMQNILEQNTDADTQAVVRAG